MKIVKELTIIVLMITILMILSIKVEATTGKINSETVRLRKEPNTDSTILDQLDKNDEVEILEQEDGWYKVKAKIDGETITGYVSEKLVDVEEGDETTSSEDISTGTEAGDTTLNQDNENTDTTTDTMPAGDEDVNTDIDTDADQQEEVAEPSTETVNTSTEIKVNEQYDLTQDTEIKALPLINSRTKAEINGNIKVVEIINDWCRIENDIHIGWVRVNTIKKSTTSEVVQEPEQQPEPEETPQTPPEDSNEKQEDTSTVTNLNKIGYVSADGLIVREEPTTSSKELDSLSKNDKVEIVGKVDIWYQIKLDGKTGYVSSKYVSDTKVIETTSRSGSTIKNQDITPMEEPKKEESASKSENPSGTTGAAVVEYAKQYLGYKYVSGGSSPERGFDCSGFTSYVYKHFGVSLNRSSKGQIKNGVAVDRSNLQPGDLVIFNNSGNTAIGHVGIYIGGNNFIHAANAKEGVKITSLSSSYYKPRYVGARRVI